jgi:hypothetical protein
MVGAIGSSSITTFVSSLSQEDTRLINPIKARYMKIFFFISVGLKD